MIRPLRLHRVNQDAIWQKINVGVSRVKVGFVDGFIQRVIRGKFQTYTSNRVDQKAAVIFFVNKNIPSVGVDIKESAKVARAYYAVLVHWLLRL